MNRSRIALFSVKPVEDCFSAFAQQLTGEFRTDGFGFVHVAGFFTADYVAAIRLTDKCTQMQFITIDRGMTCDRYLAAAIEAMVQRALSDDTVARGGVVEY